MVAALEAAASKPERPLRARELAFAEAVALGSSLTAAYKLAIRPHATRRTAEVEGSRLGIKLRGHIQRLRAESWSQKVLVMQERRALLAETARGAKGAPTHADRIRAIAEDATLAGERRQDESQANVGVVIDMSQVLAALAGAIVGGSAVQQHASARAASQPQRAEPVFDLVASPVAQDETTALAPPVTEIAAPQEMASAGVDPVGAGDVWADE